MKKLIYGILLSFLLCGLADAAILIQAHDGSLVKAASLAAANVAANDGKTIRVTSALTAGFSNISSLTTHTWRPGIKLAVEKGGSIGNTTLFRIDPKSFDGQPYQQFTGTGRVIFTAPAKVYPEQWGGIADLLTDIGPAARYAMDSIRDNGGTLFLSGRYLMDSAGTNGGVEMGVNTSIEGYGERISEFLLGSNFPAKPAIYADDNGTLEPRIYLKKFYLYANTTSAASGFHAKHTGSSTLDDMLFDNFQKGSAIELEHDGTITTSSYYNQIRNTRISRSKYGITLTGTSGDQPNVTTIIGGSITGVAPYSVSALDMTTHVDSTFMINTDLAGAFSNAALVAVDNTNKHTFMPRFELTSGKLIDFQNSPNITVLPYNSGNHFRQTDVQTGSDQPVRMALEKTIIITGNTPLYDFTETAKASSQASEVKVVFSNLSGNVRVQLPYANLAPIGARYTFSWTYGGEDDSAHDVTISHTSNNTFGYRTTRNMSILPNNTITMMVANDIRWELISGMTQYWSAQPPTTGIWPRGFQVLRSDATTGQSAGMVVTSRIDTAMRVAAVATDTIMEVDGTSGMLAGDYIGILMDTISGQPEYHWTTIASVTDGDTLVLTAAIPTGRAVAIDKPVYTMRWKALANLS